MPQELRPTNTYPLIISANNVFAISQDVDIVPVAPGVAVSASGEIIAQHADYALVTDSHPAVPNEVVTVYLVGLGATNPSVPSGQVAPSDPAAQLSSDVQVLVSSQNAQVEFAGLTPGSVGLYQINFQIPAASQPGRNNLEILVDGVPANAGALPTNK